MVQQQENGSKVALFYLCCTLSLTERQQGKQKTTPHAIKDISQNQFLIASEKEPRRQNAYSFVTMKSGRRNNNFRRDTSLARPGRGGTPWRGGGGSGRSSSDDSAGGLCRRLPEPLSTSALSILASRYLAVSIHPSCRFPRSPWARLQVWGGFLAGGKQCGVRAECAWGTRRLWLRTPSGGQQAESRPEEGPEAHSRGRSGRRPGKRVAAGGGGGTSGGRSSSRLFPGAQRGFEPFPPFLTREDPQGARFREQLPSEACVML